MNWLETPLPAAAIGVLTIVALVLTVAELIKSDGTNDDDQ